jgi:histone H3/H4
MFRKMPSRKKQTRHFEIYVLKLLKQQYPDNSLNTNTKQQLNSVLCHLATRISADAKSSCLHAGRRTITHEDVIVATKMLLADETRRSLDIAVEEMYQTLETEKVTKDAVNDVLPKEKGKGERREVKLGLVFPPAVAEKFLREKGSSGLMVAKKASVILCVVLETIMRTILTQSVAQMNTKKKRLTIQDVNRAVTTNTSLVHLFHKCTLQFIGGGPETFIHPLLSVKTGKSKHDVYAEDDTKTRRYNPGTLVLKEIKKLQKVYNKKIIAKVPFDKVVREIFVEKKCDSKISKQVFTVLQYYLESYLVDILHQSNLAALHAGRLKVIPEDIDFVHSIRNNLLPTKVQVLMEGEEGEESEESE